MNEPRGDAGVKSLIRGQIQEGLGALKDGRPAEAREIFSLILEANPELAVAQVGLGRSYAAEGDHQRALEHFEAALKVKPDFAAAIMFAAQAREKLGQGAQAMKDYGRAVELDPSLSFGYQRMARLMVKNDQGDAALETLREAVTHSPQDPGVRLMLANALQREGGAGAEAEYRRAIELKPDLWIAHYQLGRALMQAGNFAQARDSLARAAALAGDKAQVQQALGAAYAGLGDHQRAAKAYDEAFRLKPSSLRMAIKAAEARTAQGKHREALDLLAGLGRMSKRSPLVQKATGDIYFAMGKWVEASESYVAMVLNAEGLAERAPDLVSLAQAPAGPDPEARARALHDALATRAGETGDKLRANPRLVRDWIAKRRGGRALNRG